MSGQVQNSAVSALSRALFSELIIYNTRQGDFYTHTTVGKRWQWWWWCNARVIIIIINNTWIESACCGIRGEGRGGKEKEETQKQHWGALNRASAGAVVGSVCMGCILMVGAGVGEQRGSVGDYQQALNELNQEGCFHMMKWIAHSKQMGKVRSDQWIHTAECQRRSRHSGRKTHLLWQIQLWSR